MSLFLVQEQQSIFGLEEVVTQVPFFMETFAILVI
jgi:hypothetical protein